MVRDSWNVLVSRVRGFLRREAMDREFLEELESHLAMAEEEKVRQGFTRREARRRARIELGGLAQLREAGREARGLPPLETFWLDLKLGFRMLKKSWGLTLVGGLAMTLAITVGVVLFWLLEMLFDPSLNLEEGRRVIAIQTWDERGGRRVDSSAEDVRRWSERLRSVEDFGAFETRKQHLVTANGWAAEVAVAEMTASGFALARVAPLLGRSLSAADERADAPPVLVIGHDVWRTRFAGDPEVLGRTVKLDDVSHTVIGVMPDGFAFPLHHGFWTPLSIDRLESPLADAEIGGGLFARLTAGASAKSAEEELLSLGLLAPAAAESGSGLRPRLVSYPFAFTDDFAPGEVLFLVRVLLFLAMLLLVPPCANIAILVYARTITRQRELAARFALGARRSRLVGQIFLEVWVLALVAAGLALVATHFIAGLLERRVAETASEPPPFWYDFSLSPGTVVFAALLALIAAGLASIVPALKATGSKMQGSLRSLGGGAGLQLGPTWTFLVIAQVALTLAALPSAVEMAWGTVRESVLGPGFAAEQYLTARLDLRSEEAAGDGADREQRFALLENEVRRRLEEEPEVLAVAASTSVPGRGPWSRIEVEGVELVSETILESRDIVQSNAIDPSFFEVYDAAILVGRGLERGDEASASRPLVVSQTFVDLLLGETNPLGRRLRYTHAIDGEPLDPAKMQTWFEIVGVVEDFPAHGARGTIYHPRTPGLGGEVTLSARVAGQPERLPDRLRDLVAAVENDLRLSEVRTLDSIYRDEQVGNNVGTLTLAVVTLSVLLLSAAGIYALMAFTVQQRRREIGIRAALGASPQRLMLGIFRRSLLKISVGALIGSAAALFFDRLLPIEQVGGQSVPGVIPLAALFMALVGLVATAGPARRGLRVDPIEELREG
ncbi:MAG: ABC transporter permease [Acidobacteriota bacterium]